MCSLYWAQRFLSPKSILYLYKSTIRPCSQIWDGAPRSHGLDLLDRVQKWVFSLVGSGLSSNLQALSHRREVASFSLFYKYYLWISYTPPPPHPTPPHPTPQKYLSVRTTRFFEQLIVIPLILLYVGLSFINQAFFLALQSFETT